MGARRVRALRVRGTAAGMVVRARGNGRGVAGTGEQPVRRRTDDEPERRRPDEPSPAALVAVVVAVVVAEVVVALLLLAHGSRPW